MKKLLITSATLFLFSASIFMFQISCSKDANAGNSGGSGINSISKIIYYGGNTPNNPSKIYIKNADGTGTTTIISPSLPSGFDIYAGDLDIHSDGTYIYFSARKLSSQGTTERFLFRCDMNGLNSTQLTSETDIKGSFSIY